MKITGVSRRLGQSDLSVGPIAYGLWRFIGRDVRAARARIEAALEAGMTLIDNAAVYGLDWGGSAFGESETLLGKVLAEAPHLRDRMVLATKFGITPGVPYDSGAEAIVKSCDESLARLDVDVIDLFQVHRQDILTHPAEIGETLSRLREQGKIREIGVSNYGARQTLILQQFTDFPITTIQPEFSALQVEAAFDGVLDYAISRQLTPLAWSPLAGGRLASEGSGSGTGEGRRLMLVNDALDTVAKREGVRRTSVALAFVMRHPSSPIPILGTQSPERIAQANEALKVNMSRADWYAILVASQGKPLP